MGQQKNMVLITKSVVRMIPISNPACLRTPHSSIKLHNVNPFSDSPRSESLTCASHPYASHPYASLPYASHPYASHPYASHPHQSSPPPVFSTRLGPKQGCGTKYVSRPSLRLEIIEVKNGRLSTLFIIIFKHATTGRDER